jgi:drug/metabolite transporter (DMT)-like permease
MTSHQEISRFALFLIVLLAALWGLSWPVMKYALYEMPPLRFRAFCVGVGGSGLLAVALMTGHSIRLKWSTFWCIVAVSAFTGFGWNVCMSFGLRLMDSGRAAILAYTFPVWSVPLSMWLLKEPLTGRRVLGLVLGMAGMLVLLGDEIYAVGRSPLGAVLMALTAFCWAVGSVLAKKFDTAMPVSSFVGYVNLFGFIPLIALSILFESGPFTPFTFEMSSMLATLYSAIIASLLCQWAWFKLVAITPSTVSSLSILSVPVVGVFLGTLLLQETPAITDYVALVLVVGSLCTVLYPSRRAEPASG